MKKRLFLTMMLLMQSAFATDGNHNYLFTLKQAKDVNTKYVQQLVFSDQKGASMYRSTWVPYASVKTCAGKSIMKTELREDIVITAYNTDNNPHFDVFLKTANVKNGSIVNTNQHQLLTLNESRKIVLNDVEYMMRVEEIKNLGEK